jgi:hypothetical protein
MRLGDFDNFRRIARDWEKARPSVEQLEGIRRQTESVRRMLADPMVQRAHADAARIYNQQNRVLAQMPDPATQRALSEAMRYIKSPAFQNQRRTILRANELTQQRVGPPGVAAAERIATRRTTADGPVEEAAERIEAGQVAELLEQATELAGNPEILGLLQQADPDALVRVDEEQREEDSIPEGDTSTEPDVGMSGAYLAEYPDLTKEDLLEIHAEILLVLYPLEVALAWLSISNPGAPIFVTLLVVVGGLITFVHFSQMVISRWDD